MNCLQLHWPVHLVHIMPTKRNKSRFISFHQCSQTALTTCAANVLQSPPLVWSKETVHGLRGGRAPRSHVLVALQRPAASRWPLAAAVHLLSRLNGSGEARVRAHVVPHTRSLNECCYSPPAAYCWLHTLPNRWLLAAVSGGRPRVSSPLE